MSLIKNFFQETRILDGGMGQELLNRGVKTYGSLWGASALLNKKYHKTNKHKMIDIPVCKIPEEYKL